MTCDVSRQSSSPRTPSPCFSCVWRRGLSTAAASSRPSPPRRPDHLIISKPGVTPVTCLPRDCASGASCFFCSAGQPAHHRARLHRLQEQDVARQRQPQRRLARVTRVVAIACRRACIHRFVRSVALALCVCALRVLLRRSRASYVARSHTPFFPSLHVKGFVTSVPPDERVCAMRKAWSAVGSSCPGFFTPTAR